MANGQWPRANCKSYGPSTINYGLWTINELWTTSAGASLQN